MFVRIFNGTKEELLYVINKLNQDIDILSIQQESKYSYKVTVKNATQARNLMNFNGVWWNDQQMIINYIEEPIKSEQFKFVLENIKHKYFDIITRTLNLSSLQEKLTEQKFYPEEEFDQVFRNALKYFYNEIPDLLSLDISHNNLLNTYFFNELLYGFKELTDFNCSYNSISSTRCFQELHGLPLRRLTTIGNPFGEEFPIELRDTFPLLEYYNGELIRPNFFPTTIHPTISPLKYNTMFPFNEEKFGSIYDFLVKYFEFFDGNRDELYQFYNDQSFFDITLNDNLQFSNIKSRDISLFDPTPILKNIYQGSESIVNKIKELEQTTHRLCDLCFDVVDFNGVCIITLHGQCTMKGIIYQYCRTFIINENPFIIMNDHLQLFDGFKGFMVVKTFSKYIKYITQRFPGFSEKDGLYILEKHHYNVFTATQEISEHFHHTLLTSEELNPMNLLGGEFSQDEIQKLNPQSIEELISLGLEKELAMRALLINGGNIHLAADYGMKIKSHEIHDQTLVMTGKNKQNITNWNLFDDQHIQLMIETTNASEVLCKQLYLKHNKDIERAVAEYFDSYI